jgi:Tol biopolymer transport system component
MRMLALAAAAAAGSLLQHADPNEQLLTVPQGDRLKSRLSASSASVSGDGRYVALTSYARLTPADADDLPDIYILDRATHRVSIETPAIGLASYTHPRISADGRYLTFDETLPADEGRFSVRLVVRDRISESLTRVADGILDRWTGSGAPSGDGRIVAFASNFTSLTRERDENGDLRDVYLLDAGTGAIVRASVDSRGRQPPRGESFVPAVNGSGRYVVFTSTADLDDRIERDTQRMAGVYLRDTQLQKTRCISGGTRSKNLRGSSYDAVISGDGRYVAFVSDDTGIVADDRNRTADVFLYDVVADASTLVSRSAAGGSANGASRNPAISADGRYVAFQSDASDLVCAARCTPADEDINLLPDIFLFDRVTGKISRLSGGTARGWMEESVAPAISGDGSVVAFSSRHPIDAQDVDHDFDLFIRVAGPVRPPR